MEDHDYDAKHTTHVTKFCTMSVRAQHFEVFKWPPQSLKQQFVC